MSRTWLLWTGTAIATGVVLALLPGPQLGSDKPEVRLGGIYALERLMAHSSPDLAGATLTGADLTGGDLTGTDLRDMDGLTPDQVRQQARTDAHTRF